MRASAALRERSRSSLALRLGLPFVAVTLLAVLILSALAVVFGGQKVDTMVADRRAELVRSLRANAVSTYVSSGDGWAGADLRPALDLAARYGTNVAVLDAHGRVVAATARSPVGEAGASSSRIVAGGREVGTLVVRSTGSLGDSVGKLRRSLLTAVVAAACLAAMLACVVATAVARRLTAPLGRLIRAAEAMARGMKDVRVGDDPRAPRELRELAATFDALADALARQDQLRRDLVSDVAHELRTPVAVLQASLEAMVDGVVPQTTAEAESLHEEVIRLAERVEDLQALARADAAALSLHRVPCDLARLTRSAVDQLLARAEAAGLAVTTDLTQAWVEADPQRMHQVVTNLLVNAIKFTPPGGQVHVAVGNGDGARARLVVRDTGVGIAPADIPHVFERFWRSADTDHVTGSGIGLTIVAQLVDAHGGTVDVASEPGVGTTMTVTL